MSDRPFIGCGGVVDDRHAFAPQTRQRDNQHHGGLDWLQGDTALKNRQCLVLQTGNGFVIEVKVGNLNGEFWARGFCGDGKAVVLAGNFYFPRQANGLIQPSVTKLELKKSPPLGRVQTTDAPDKCQTSDAERPVICAPFQYPPAPPQDHRGHWRGKCRRDHS